MGKQFEPRIVVTIKFNCKQHFVIIADLLTFTMMKKKKQNQKMNVLNTTNLYIIFKIHNSCPFNSRVYKKTNAYRSGLFNTKSIFIGCVWSIIDLVCIA